MARLYSLKNALHRDSALSIVLERIGGKDYFAILRARPTTPTISTLTTTNGNWVALATGLTNLLQWKISELNGNDFHYAFVVAPGNNFSVGFGWVEQNTAPSAIYVKRPGSSNITLKLERWAI